MPEHRAFFPEKPSKDKTVNKTINIPNNPEEPPITIKSKKVSLFGVEIINSNPVLENIRDNPTIRAPEPVIQSKKNSFFNLF